MINYSGKCDVLKYFYSPITTTIIIFILIFKAMNKTNVMKEYNLVYLRIKGSSFLLSSLDS